MAAIVAGSTGGRLAFLRHRPVSERPDGGEPLDAAMVMGYIDSEF